MQEIAAQIRTICPYCTEKYWHMAPYGDEDREAVGNYHTHQVILIKAFGAKKQRSVAQLNTFMKICTMIGKIAEERNEHSWDHKDKVKFQVKVGIQFIDATKTIVGVDGKVHLHYRSISFKELPHMEATNFFERAYKFLDKALRKMAGVKIEELFKQINLTYDPRYR